MLGSACWSRRPIPWRVFDWRLQRRTECGPHSPPIADEATSTSAFAGYHGSMKNGVGREIPESVDGRPLARTYTGPLDHLGKITRAPTLVTAARPGRSKVLPSIRRALEACELRDGATISFHHHLRNGDKVLNTVLNEISTAGLRDIRIAPSSLFPVHAPLVGHIRNGVVTGIHATFVSGPVGAAIARGQMQTAASMYSHGGRVRAIEAGDLHIDTAFIAAPTADTYGSINGVGGPSACGTLGYAIVDAERADHVVAVTDHLVPYPACPIQISQEYVDFVVPIDSVGDPSGIASGAMRPVDDPLGLHIARSAADVIEASGLLQHGFSFQTGAGGTSLAVADFVADAMTRRGLRGSFASGGITGRVVRMLEDGLFRTILDVQCFDLGAVDSYRRNPLHQSMSASTYANPHNRGAVVNQLDVVVLGAAEVDLDFNVNVTTGSHGLIIGGSGGHCDTAAGAKLAVVTTRLNAGGYAKIVDQVRTVTTPGHTIDVVVTEAGIAVNPARGDIADRLHQAGLPVVSIDRLRDLAKRQASGAAPAPVGERVVAVVEYRDGTVIDVVRQPSD